MQVEALNATGTAGTTALPAPDATTTIVPPPTAIQPVANAATTNVPPQPPALPAADAAGTSTAATTVPPLGDAPPPLQPAAEPAAAPDAQQQVLDAVTNHGAGQMPLFAGIVSMLQRIPRVGARSDNAMQLLEDLLALMGIVVKLTEACTPYTSHLVACLADTLRRAQYSSHIIRVDIAEWERRLQSPDAMAALINFAVHNMLKKPMLLSSIITCMRGRLSDPELESDLIKNCFSIAATLHDLTSNLDGPTDRAIMEAFQEMLDVDMLEALKQCLGII